VVRSKRQVGFVPVRLRYVLFEYEYSDLSVSKGATLDAKFTVKNVSEVPGTEIAEVYASLPASAGEPPKRLIGWSRVKLLPGESKQVSIPISGDRLKIYEEQSDSWRLVPGSYAIRVGGSSQSLPLEHSITLE
jgi:beta-glucosidase